MVVGYQIPLGVACRYLVWILGVGANSTMAQTPPTQKERWDAIPEICKPLPGKRVSPCDISEYPNFEETSRIVRALYITEQFSTLEEALTDIAASKKRYRSGRHATSAAYAALRAVMPGPGVSPDEKGRVARWRKAAPKSYFVPFAEARFLYASAWNARGSGYASSVSKESWKIFATRLQEAERVLLRAPQALKDTTYWHHLLLAITLDTDTTQSRPKETFERAVNTWPDYYEFYEVMLTRLSPKWGGSWELVDSFIDYWAKQQAQREGSSLYARLYISLIRSGGTPDQTRFDWKRMKPSLIDLNTRYPDPIFKNFYASYACFAKDRGAYTDAMRKFSPNWLQPDAWLDGHSHEACNAWLRAGTPM